MKTYTLRGVWDLRRRASRAMSDYLRANYRPVKTGEYALSKEHLAWCPKCGKVSEIEGSRGPRTADEVLNTFEGTPCPCNQGAP